MNKIVKIISIFLVLLVTLSISIVLVKKRKIEKFQTTCSFNPHELHSRMP